MGVSVGVEVGFSRPVVCEKGWILSQLVFPWAILNIKTIAKLAKKAKGIKYLLISSIVKEGFPFDILTGKKVF